MVVYLHLLFELLCYFSNLWLLFNPSLYLLSGLYVLLCQTGAIQYLPDFVDPVSIAYMNKMNL